MTTMTTATSTFESYLLARASKDDRIHGTLVEIGRLSHAERLSDRDQAVATLADLAYRAGHAWDGSAAVALAERMYAASDRFYEVRKPGTTAWESNIDSLEAARQSQREARDAGVDATIFEVDAVGNRKAVQ